MTFVLAPINLCSPFPMSAVCVGVNFVKPSTHHSMHIAPTKDDVAMEQV